MKVIHPTDVLSYYIQSNRVTMKVIHTIERLSYYIQSNTRKVLR